MGLLTRGADADGPGSEAGSEASTDLLDLTGPTEGGDPTQVGSRASPSGPSGGGLESIEGRLRDLERSVQELTELQRSATTELRGAVASLDGSALHEQLADVTAAVQRLVEREGNTSQVVQAALDRREETERAVLGGLARTDETVVGALERVDASLTRFGGQVLADRERTRSEIRAELRTSAERTAELFGQRADRAVRGLNQQTERLSDVAELVQAALDRREEAERAVLAALAQTHETVVGAIERLEVQVLVDREEARSQDRAELRTAAERAAELFGQRADRVIGALNEQRDNLSEVAALLKVSLTEFESQMLVDRDQLRSGTRAEVRAVLREELERSAHTVQVRSEELEEHLDRALGVAAGLVRRLRERDRRIYAEFVELLAESLTKALGSGTRRQRSRFRRALSAAVADLEPAIAVGDEPSLPTTVEAPLDETDEAASAPLDGTDEATSAPPEAEQPAVAQGYRCQVCGFEARSGGGLASHRRTH